MSKMQQVARKAVKVTAIGGGIFGSYRFVDTFLNDNLDDIPYALKSKVVSLWSPADEEGRRAWDWMGRNIFCEEA